MKVLCLLGPTASGKTNLAIELVKKSNYEIISVDSAMIYKGMNIGTGKPGSDILKQVPHRLVDILEPYDSYSVGDFCKDVKTNIIEIHGNNKIPILVGGTMMYFNALFNGLGDMPPSDINIRKKLDILLKAKGLDYLYEELSKIDQESVKKIHGNDTQRILRALEVYYVSGKPISSFKNNSESILSNYDVTNIVIYPESRKELHENIAKRFHDMLDQGFIKEVENLYNRKDLDLNMPSIRSVGYKQAWQYLKGELDYDEMVEKSIAATRQLAKRQFTWIRKLEKDNKFFYLDNLKDDILDKVLLNQLI
tara:strand:- start:4855 stop:5778 length:924 start_codon:yes stop_codon:yes gene_type:complete